MEIQVEAEREIPLLVDLPGKCIWLKQEGDEVFVSEEVGYIVIEEKNRLPLRSPAEGILKSILIHGDMKVNPTDEKVPVAIISSCFHAYVLNNRCINCQKYIDDEDLRKYRQVITYDGFVEYLKEEFYNKEKNRVLTRMLQNRKLGLVFDLDNTLIEQSSDMRCVQAAKFGIPDVNIIQFERNGHSITNVILLRGGIKRILKELSSLFDLSVYTNGIREYAEAVVNVIDPDHSLFGNRIIARNDVPENSQRVLQSNFVPASKDISLVLPGYDEIGIAVDDSGIVWKDQSSVLTVPPFHFWNAFLQSLDYLDNHGITDEETKRKEMYNRVSRFLNGNDMMIIRDSLFTIHKQFYSRIQPDVCSVECPVGSVIRDIRGQLLKGRVLYFDSLENMQSKEYYIDLTRQLGGRVEETFSSDVTHFVSAGKRTQVFIDNCMNEKIRFVNEFWIISCFSFAICLSSKGYPVRGIEKIRELHNQQKTQDGGKSQEVVEEKKSFVDPELADVLEELNIMENTPTVDEKKTKRERIERVEQSEETKKRKRNIGSDLKYAPFRYEEKTDLEPHPKENVLERGLVIDQVEQVSILDENARYSSQTDVKNTKEMPILGFVTPWNKHGYDVARVFKNKFTHISPCWFQVRRNDAQVLIITGEQDIDKEWIADLRKDCVGSCPKIVPRLVWEASAINDDDVPILLKLITDLIDTNNFDGFVFEFSFSKPAIPIFTQIREAIGSKIFITTVHPEHLRYIGEEEEVVQQMTNLVDFTVLMTYDYSNKLGKLGSNAPLSYYKKSIKKYLKGVDSKEKKSVLEKLMLGLPMYGYRDYDSITGDALLNLLKRFTMSIEYHENSQDHFMRYKDEKGKSHFVSYPSLLFLQSRIDLAKKLNTGLSIWEMGQGLDYFYDLFCFVCSNPQQKVCIFISAYYKKQQSCFMHFASDIPATPLTTTNLDSYTLLHTSQRYSFPYQKLQYTCN